MGRTNPTYRDALRALADRWADYRRALRPADRDRFDRLLDDARDYADAGGHLNPHDPVVAVLLSVALAQERRVDDLRDRVGELEERVTAVDGGTGGRNPEGTRTLAAFLTDEDADGDPDAGSGTADADAPDGDPGAGGVADLDAGRAADRE